MKSVRPSSPRVADIEPYDPKSLPADVFISANESPYNIPASVRESIVKRIAALDFNRYPDPLANALRDKIAAHYGLERDNVILGNGGDEILFNLMLTWGGPGRTLMSFPPCFGIYELNAQITGTKLVEIERVGDDYHIDVDAAVERLQQGDIDVVILTSPNNPTGCCTPVEDVRRILDASNALVLVDEAYIEFAPQKTCRELLDRYENCLILHTFSKAFSAAGVRLGYYLGAKSVITEFLKVRQAYSVDSLSQVVGEEVMDNIALLQPQIDAITNAREELLTQLTAINGVQVHPTDANFILVTLPHAKEVWKCLYDEHSVLVRNVSGDPRLADCLRITVGAPDENAKLIAALKSILSN